MLQQLVLSPMQIHACFLFFWEGRPHLSLWDLSAFWSWLWYTEAKARRSQDHDTTMAFLRFECSRDNVHLQVEQKQSLPGNTKPHSADIFVKCKEAQGQEMKASRMINSALLLIKENKETDWMWWSQTLGPTHTNECGNKGEEMLTFKPSKGFCLNVAPNWLINMPPTCAAAYCTYCRTNGLC